MRPLALTGQMSGAFQLSGHRGARGLWPENTLAGFAGALRLGVDALELDVVLSADAVPVVVHDLTLDPDLVREPGGVWLETPGLAVRSLELATLKRLDVGRARPGSPVALAHPRQTAVDGQTIPTLAEVFRLAGAHPTVRLEVEIKTDPTFPELSPDPRELVDRIMAEAAAAGVAARMSLRSFDWRGLHHAAARWPSVPLCFLTEEATPDVLGAVRQAAGGRATDWATDWAPDFTTLTGALVAEARRHGLAVKPWTVNRPEDMARLIAWGVDGLCTDDPDIARAAMAQAGLPLPPALPACLTTPVAAA